MGVKYNSSGGGSVLLDAPSTASNLTVTLPSASGTLATTDGGNTTFTSITDSGNLTFTGTGNRITGDFSNGTTASRVYFQSSTTNGNTVLGAIPNGTATTSVFDIYNSSDLSNYSNFRFLISSSEASLRTAQVGTGTYLPMTFQTGGSERMRIDTSGNVGIGVTPLSSVRLQVRGGGNTSASYAVLFTDSGGNNLLYARNDGAMGFGVSGTAMALDVYSNLALSSATTANCFISFSNSADNNMQGYVGDSKAICSTGANNFIGVRGESGIIFGVGNTENMRLQTGGTLILKGGSTSATGTGITFPATQSASSDANTLDDYEEGTFAVQYLGSGTNPTVVFDFREGTYTKVGNLVTFAVRCGVSTSSGGSGNLRMSLPFAVRSSPNEVGAVVSTTYGWGTNYPVNALIEQGTTSMVFYKATNSSTSVVVGDLTNGSRLWITGSYFAA